MKTIPYARQELNQADIKAALKSLNSDWLTQGPAVKAFELDLCRATGAKYATAVSNGTAALHLAMMAIGVGPGDEVITSPITFAASANCALYVGARPVFVDIEEQTYHLDPDQLKKFLKTSHRRVKAIVPVHFSGTVCQMEAIQGIARRHSIKVIEDAAHALGSQYRSGDKWFKVGGSAHSDATMFSFHPIKQITTGEGGAILTNRKEIYEKINQLRHHGIIKNHTSPASDRLKAVSSMGWFYDIPDIGFNYRITDMQCALGISQLKKLNQFVTRRRALVKKYNEAFAKIEEIRRPYERPDTKASYHLYVIRVPADLRDRLYNHLREKGITTQINYIPVHLLSSYKRLGYKFGDFPIAEKYFSECLSLPLFPGLTDADQQRIIKTIKRFFGYG